MKYKKELLEQQRNELTEHIIYSKLAKISKIPENTKILQKIADDEKKHFTIWKEITKEDVKEDKMKIFFYVLLAKILGLSFSLKLMEAGEGDAQKFYKKISKHYPIAKKIGEDEKKHELKLIRILKDKRLTYAGSIVLGLNDALVELTGTLAGLTLTFNNAKIIGITGLIMGIAASMSMAASGYLASREEEESDVNPIKAAIYTGVAYIITVALLIFPYFIFEGVYTALAVMLGITVLIIAAYTSYISIAKEVGFKRRFSEMALISLGVAIISYGIGFFVKTYFGIEI